MDEAGKIANFIQQSLPNVKRGTPRFFGDWYGKPMDDRRAVVAAEADGDCLVLGLDAGETLRVWNPKGCEVGRDGFVITGASRVVFEWHPADRERTEENRLFREYVVRQGAIEARTNVDRLSARLKPKVGYPAVELC